MSMKAVQTGVSTVISQPASFLVLNVARATMPPSIAINVIYLPARSQSTKGGEF